MIVPESVNLIIRKLNNAGFEAYAVGGCVRDTLLKRTPKDWDITTNANPLEVKSIFKKTVDTGLKHGTVTVLIDKEGYEVTTYRIDGDYNDGRHPDNVTFTTDLKEDLRRRDFTINAIAYNDETGYVDCFNGKADISDKIIRCVGDADERFSEDALRIMRAVRFAGELGFEIENNTFDAIKRHVNNLKNVSAERIRTELEKLLISPEPEKFLLLYETKITRIILPEFDICMDTKQETVHHIYDVGMHSIHSVMNMNYLIRHAKGMRDEESYNNFIKRATKDFTPERKNVFEKCLKKIMPLTDRVLKDITLKEEKILAFTMLLHDIAKPLCKTMDENGAHFKGHPKVSSEIAHNILRKLKCDNETIKSVTHLVYYHDYRTKVTRKNIRRGISRIGKDYIWFFHAVTSADILAQNPDLMSKKCDIILEGSEISFDILKENECLTIKELKITGTDLIKSGIKPGPEVGDVLKKLLEAVIDEPALNEYDKLLTLSNEWRDRS